MSHYCMLSEGLSVDFLTEGSGQGIIFKEALDVIFPINSGQGTTPSAMSLILFMRS